MKLRELYKMNAHWHPFSLVAVTVYLDIEDESGLPVSHLAYRKLEELVFRNAGNLIVQDFEGKAVYLRQGVYAERADLNDFTFEEIECINLDWHKYESFILYFCETGYDVYLGTFSRDKTKLVCENYRICAFDDGVIFLERR